MSVGALLMVVGVFVTIFSVGTFIIPTVRAVATLSYAVGATVFAAMQMMQTYQGGDFVIRRLRRIMLIGNVCLLLSALLMVEQTFRIAYPLMATSIDGYNNYCRYVSNNWGVLLLISCLLQIYSTLRIAKEIKKEV